MEKKKGLRRELKTLRKNINKKITAFTNMVLLGIKISIIALIVFISALIFIVRPLNIKNNFAATQTYEEKITHDLSREEFLERVTPDAMSVAQKQNIRPSLLVAQAALESNWGNSSLARESNNLFGIKGSSGKIYPTTEYENNEKKNVDAAFKEYRSVYASMEDYAVLLNEGTSWNAELYAEVINADNYTDAALAIQEAGYATDPAYSEKIIKIIEQYELYKLDEQI